MDIRKKQRAVVEALENIKGRDIVVYNVERLSAIFERVVIASGDSTRQVKALGAKVRSIEGQGNAEWMLVDLGDIVVHVMHPTVRSYYNLEEIWGGKEVKLKSAEPPKRAAKAPAAKRKAKKAAPAKRAKAPRRGRRG